MPSWNDLVNWLIDTFYYCVNGCIKALCDLFTWILSYIPDSVNLIHPTDPYVMGQVLKTLNWVFPVSFTFTLIGLFFTSVAVYFSVKFILRWL